MMYSNQFVVSIKCNNNIMRENKDVVYLPFGSEYSILLKNLSNRKASVKIWIDGEDIFDNTSLIVNSNETVELERFYKSNHKFKFIEKTDEISEYRGDKIDDGIVRVEYTFEQEIPYIKPYVYKEKKYDEWHDNSAGAFPYRNTWTSDRTTTFCQLDAFDISCNTNESSITVKGSESYQTFVDGYINILETTAHVIVLNLKGYNQNKKVNKPIYVKTKITCETCGKKNKNRNKFCSNCGTALTY